MERTLNSVGSSDGNSDVSYLCARDPSILTYSQRPIPVEKKNLISLYEEEEDTENLIDDTALSVADPNALQTIKVYLRLKPFPRKIKLTAEDADAYQILNPTTLLTKLPSLDHTTSSISGARITDSVCRKFTFSHTFGPETTQSMLFEQVIQPRLVDFLVGHNTTVMTYGTTSSGKSYTLQGTTTSPGIIPRGLEFVFSNINTRPTPSYKPVHNSDIVCLTPVDRAQELEAKNKLLTFASVDKSAYINAYRQMQKLLQEESPIRPSQACDAQYSVWVSFAEIYNENIYDLLSNDCQKRRPLLKVGTDSRGRPFIKGLKTVCVNSGSEAYQVLMAGQYNLKVAATALNSRSSRSHCIFTIKLLKYYVENVPDSVEVSTFAFCDLAGSERLKKTLNVGERLKEAQNINTSLLVLGRCLKSIYEGQSTKQKHEHVGPFRESKLTMLFQRALSGKEKIVLIVNVNPLPNLYVETQNVLNFAAIAKKIVIEEKKIKRKVSHTRFSQIVAKSGKSSTNWNDTELENMDEPTDATEEMEHSVFLHQDEYDELLHENKSLKKEIKCLKKEIGSLKASMFNRDLEIRQELADMYTAMMKKLETDWKNRIKDVEEQQEDYLEWSVNRVETYYKDKISELTSRKRRRSRCDDDDDIDDDDDDDDDDGKHIGVLEIENSRLKTEVQSLKKKLANVRADNEAVNTEKNKIAFELGLTKEELKSVKILLASAQEDLCSDEDSTKFIDKLRSQLNEKQERIKNLKEFLEEAKEEYIQITSHEADLERRLQKKEEYLIDSQERISDLEELVEQANICLAENTKEKEILEERVNYQSNLLSDAEKREQIAQVKLIESENTIQQLKAKILLLENSLQSNNATSDSTTTTEDSMVTEVKVKQEVLSESDGDSSFVYPKSPVSKDIVIKTDNDGILEIPVTSYENERASEMFVEVREISSPANSPESDPDSPADLRAKLDVSEAENAVLKTKLSQSFAEIRSLKESLDLMKFQCNNITETLVELKVAQNLEAEKKALKELPTKIQNDQASSPIKLGAPSTAVETIESGSQTAVVPGNHRTVQTSFGEPSTDENSFPTTNLLDDRLRESETQLQDLRVQYNELEAECKEKALLLQQLKQEVQTLQVANDALNKKSINDDAKMDELSKTCASTTGTLENDLAKVVAEKEVVQAALRETENLLKSVESQLNTCLNEKEVKISNLEKELAAANEREDAHAELEQEHLSELKKAHANKMSECETAFQLQVKELEEKINEITKSCEQCTAEKKELEEKLKENTAEVEVLQKRLQIADKKEQEKDVEIKQLQKALKTQLSSDVNDKKMQKEFKETLKELNETREALKRTDELYKRVQSSSATQITDFEMQISALEKKVKSSELIEANAEQDRAELERLHRENEELVSGLCQKDREMESFMKNRDETNAKWEHLMKSKQEELDRSTNEIKRLQDLLQRMPTTPRDKGMKSEEDTLKMPIPVIDLSGSESKRATRRTAVPHPAICPSSETKRSTRRKRLYNPADNSTVDLESCEEIPPTPPVQTPATCTRSLRTRRK